MVIKRRRQIVPELVGDELCAYCGEVALAVDHVFPHKEFGDDTPFVPTCIECNYVAAAKVFDTFEAKRDFVQALLMKKHAKILRCDFTEEEIATLKGRLRQCVMQGIKQRAILLQRIFWDEPPQYLRNPKYTGWAE